MLEEMDTLFGGPNHIERGGAQMFENADNTIRTTANAELVDLSGAEGRAPVITPAESKV
jgi:hypothetical protein